MEKSINKSASKHIIRGERIMTLFDAQMEMRFAFIGRIIVLKEEKEDI